MTHKLEPLFWLDGARGVYIPRDFSRSFADRAHSVDAPEMTAEDWMVLDYGPQGEAYWDVWDDVLHNAIVRDGKGNRYYLHQDGDLWLIPEGMIWSDQDDFFIWEDDHGQESENQAEGETT